MEVLSPHRWSIDDICAKYGFLGVKKAVDSMGQPLGSTPIYKKYFDVDTNEGIYVGRLDHKTYAKSKDKQDKFFTQFQKETLVEFKEEYLFANYNFEAGYKSASKYCKKQPVLDFPAFHCAWEWMCKHFTHCMGSEVCSWEDACQMANKTSSAGYPWSKKFPTKGSFLNQGMEVLEKRWEELQGMGQPSPVLWKSSVKTELRSVEKLKTVPPSLRTFTASSVEHTIPLARFCLDFNERFYSNSNQTWSFVGSTPYLRGFDRIMKRLEKHPNGFCLDESSYDCSIFRMAFEGVVAFRWNCLKKEHRTPANKRRLIHLYNDIVFSYMVLDSGEIYQKTTGNPSGSANTIVDNTLVLFCLLAYAFIKLAPSGVSYEFFIENVEAALNGDDNTFTVSNLVVPWFNAKAVSEVWGSIGVTTRSETGSWEPVEPQKLEFLSSTFIKHKGCYLPCPDYHKVMCSLKYGADIHDPRYSLMRAYALRLPSWPNKQCRLVLEKYIVWLRDHFKDELCGVLSIEGQKMTMNDINSIFKTDSDIEGLYLGYECTVDLNFPEAVQKIINYRRDKSFHMVKQGKLNVEKLERDAKRELMDAKRLAVDTADFVRDLATESVEAVKEIPERLGRMFRSPKSRNIALRAPPPTPRPRRIKRGGAKQLVLKPSIEHSDTVTNTKVPKVTIKPPVVKNLDTVFQSALDTDSYYVNNYSPSPIISNQMIENWARALSGPDYPFGEALQDLQQAIAADSAYYGGLTDATGRVYGTGYTIDPFKLNEEHLVELDEEGNPRIRYNVTKPERKETTYVNVPTTIHHDIDSRQIAQYKASMMDPILARLSGKEVPAPPLVGVEPNPGPKAKRGQLKTKKMKKPMIMNRRPAPVAMDYKFINNNKMKNTVIKHVEQIIEVTGSTSSYNLSLTLNLNPGLAQTFPWLSQAAQQYEAYRFREISFIYMPYVSSATSGYIAMNCDYNPQDDDVTEFQTKQAFTDYDGAVQGNSWEAMVFRVKCPNPEGPVRRSMRYGDLPIPYDLHNYDHATFNLAVGGQASTANIGTLFVHYVVELARPRIANQNIGSGFAHIYSTTGVSATVSMGTSQVTSANNIPISIGTQQITFNRVGKYYCDYQLQGTTLVGVGGPWLVASSNCTVALPSSTGGNTVVNSGQTRLAAEGLYVTVTAIPAVVIMNPITSGVSFTRCDLYVCQIPTGLSLSKNVYEKKVEELEKKIQVLEDEVKENDIVVSRYYSNSSSNSGSSVVSPQSDWDTISRKSRR